MRPLKQSTAINVPLGPITNASWTAVTNQASAAADILLVKDGLTSSVQVGAQTWTHLGGGVYNLALSTSHTDTAGRLDIICLHAGTVPSRTPFVVLPAQVYDSLITATDRLDTNAAEWSGQLTSGMLSNLGGGVFRPAVDVQAVNTNATAADNIGVAALTMVPLVVQASSTQTAIITNLTESTNDHYKGRTLLFYTGALTGQQTSISGYTGATLTLAVAQLTEAPAPGDLAIIV